MTVFARSVILDRKWLYYYKEPLIPTWISTCIHYKVWDYIIHSFPNCNGATVEVCEWISNFIAHFTGWVNIELRLKLKLVHIDISGPWFPWLNSTCTPKLLAYIVTTTAVLCVTGCFQGSLHDDHPISIFTASAGDNSQRYWYNGNGLKTMMAVARCNIYLIFWNSRK